MILTIGSKLCYYLSLGEYVGILVIYFKGGFKFLLRILIIDILVCFLFYNHNYNLFNDHAHAILAEMPLGSTFRPITRCCNGQ